MKKTAADVQQLTEHTTAQLTAIRNEIRHEATLQAQAQQAGFARMMTLIQQLTAPLTQSTAPASWAETTDYESSHPSEADNAEDDSDTMSTQTIETDNQSSIAASPVKKKSKRKSRDPTLNTVSQNLNLSNPSNQDKGASNSNLSTPEDGAL